METFTKLLRECLYAAFFNWLEVNKDTIGEKWYKDLYNKGKDAEADCNTLMKILGHSLWIFNMMANLGVMAGLGPNNFNIQGLAPGIDEPSTKRLLAVLAAALGCQGLPMEIMEQEIPIITSKHFSLALYAGLGT